MSQGAQWTIRADGQSAVIAQRGGALRSYRVAGRTVVQDVPDDEVPSAFHGAVVAPWPNRIPGGRWSWHGDQLQVPVNEAATNSALHGLVSWTAWQLVELTAASVTVQVQILPQPGYPFEVTVSATWTLSHDGLRCELRATNAGSEAAPFGITVHPYFVVPDARVDDLTLTLPARTWLETDEHLHPKALLPVTGSDRDFLAGAPLRGAALDTAFTDVISDQGTEVVLAGDRHEVVVWADAAFGWWQVYTGDYFAPDSDLYRSAVAIEPMTCGPNAFNTGRDLIVLQPGEAWSAAWGARLRRR